MKTRNRLAQSAWNKTGAGTHKDRSKDFDKFLCRQVIDEEEFETYNPEQEDGYADSF